MIDGNRLNHIFGVAKLMEITAESVGLDKEEMFTLGFLHDVGYEFGESEQHHIIGAEILKKQNYKYYQEVLHHGKPDTGYSSPQLDLLNYADMRVNKKGEVVSFEDRLADIASRRGLESVVYHNCKKIIDDLINKGFSDK